MKSYIQFLLAFERERSFRFWNFVWKSKQKYEHLLHGESSIDMKGKKKERKEKLEKNYPRKSIAMRLIIQKED